MSSSLEKLRDSLKCPICLSTIQSPTSLPCNHCFCQACIEKSLLYHHCCPVCKQYTTKRKIRPDEKLHIIIQALNQIQPTNSVPTIRVGQQVHVQTPMNRGTATVGLVHSHQTADINYTNGGKQERVPIQHLLPISPVTQSGRQAKKRIQLVGSGLSEKQKKQVRQVASSLRAQMAKEWTIHLTHLIVADVDESTAGVADKRIAKLRSLKYMQAILSGQWIVSIDWVLECQRQKQFVEEEPYEIHTDQKTFMRTQNAYDNAPKRARLAHATGAAKLFHGLDFYLLGNFRSPYPSRQDIEQLIHLGGGKHHTCPTSSTIILACSDSVVQEFRQQTPQAIVYQVEWLINSISAYRQESLENYSY